LTEEERVIQTTITSTETCAGVDADRSVCYIRKVSWHECDFNKAKHDAWHANQSQNMQEFSNIIPMFGAGPDA
jgi:hypothetical protein